MARRQGQFQGQLPDKGQLSRTLEVIQSGVAMACILVDRFCRFQEWSTVPPSLNCPCP